MVLVDTPKYTMDRRPSSAVRTTLRWSRISDFNHSQNWREEKKEDGQIPNTHFLGKGRRFIEEKVLQAAI